MPVLDEVHVPYPVDGDRWHGLAPALCLGDPLPARAHSPRGRAEAAVELPGAIDGADDRVDGNGLEPQAPLAPEAERLGHLLEGEDHVDVVVAPQAHSQTCQLLPPARATEIGLSVLGGEPG